MTLAALKAAVRRWGLSEVVVTPARGTRPAMLRLSPVSLSDAQQVKLFRRHRGDAVYSTDTNVLQVPLPKPTPEDLVGWVAGVLRDLFARAR